MPRYKKSDPSEMTERDEFDFIAEMHKKIDELDLDFEIYGLIDRNDNVYSIG